MFAGRLVVVTGASGAIGQSIVTTLAAHGASVAALSRAIQPSFATDLPVLTAEQKHCVFRCDVADESQVNKAFSEIESTFGRPLDTLITAAGVSVSSLLVRTSAESVD